MGPTNANSGRGDYFRTLLGRPATITALVVVPAIALLWGAHSGGFMALFAPVAGLAVVLGVVFFLADRKADMLFWQHVASSLGYEQYSDPTPMESTTPLMHAGDRRSFDHQMRGRLGDSGLDAHFAHYRYDVRKDNSQRAQWSHDRDDFGNEVSETKEEWDSYRFTVCVVELQAAMQLFPGIYLRAKRGLLGLGRHDWLSGRRLEEVELESMEFGDAYELQIAPEQDQGRLRELFDPKTIVWLTDHPMRPQVELRAGYLVVYVPDLVEDLGNVVWLLEAAERIAERVQAELRESQATVG